MSIGGLAENQRRFSHEAREVSGFTLGEHDRAQGLTPVPLKPPILHSNCTSGRFRELGVKKNDDRQICGINGRDLFGEMIW